MKKLVSLLLCLALCLSALSFAIAEDGAEQKAAIYDVAPFAENVTITVPVYDRSKQGYPAVDDNYWTKWIQQNFGDKYNITVKFVAIPRGDVMTKYSMLIAGDDTPTILMEYDYPKVAQWANDGAMAEINLDEFKAVAPTYYQAMVDHNQLAYTDINGKTYFVLSERPYYDTTYTFVSFCRLDWLKQVGYDKVPENYTEYCEAIGKIVDAGLTKQPLGRRLFDSAYAGNFAYRNVPVDEKEWAVYSSLGTASLTWEPTYKMLKRANDEYLKGWYSTEFELDADGSQEKTDFINGVTFSYGNYMSSDVDWLKAFYEKNPDAELAIVSTHQNDEEGIASAQIRADNPFGMIVGFSSLATPDQLKAAWMYMEWLMQPENLFVMENGVEGVTYELDADGLPVMLDYTGEEMLNHNNNIDMTCIIHASKKRGTIEQTIAAITPKGIPQDFTQAIIDNYYALKEISDAGRAYTDPVFAVAIDAESEYNGTLLSLWKEYSTKLIKAEEGQFDTLYAEFSQKFLDAGYQEILDERLAAYEAGNTTKLPENVKNAK